MKVWNEERERRKFATVIIATSQSGHERLGKQKLDRPDARLVESFAYIHSNNMATVSPLRTQAAAAPSPVQRTNTTSSIQTAASGSNTTFTSKVYRVLSPNGKRGGGEERPSDAGSGRRVSFTRESRVVFRVAVSFLI